MYGRSTMQRPAAHQSYPPFPTTAAPPAPPKQYPNAHSTSSAFSPSAAPNEDWTKISDLAERRRIQNRIAQRNYRKKLKKRLEDLERRAGSSSASPEQSHEELPHRATSPSHVFDDERRRSSSNGNHNIPMLRRASSIEEIQPQYVLQSDDRGMFSQQYTRQLSTSPPPFASYGPIASSLGGNHASYPPTATNGSFYSLPNHGVEMSMYGHYMPGFSHAGSYEASVVPGGPTETTNTPVKPELYADDIMSPFSMSYASMAGAADAENVAPLYHDMAAYVSTTARHHHQSYHHQPRAGGGGTGGGFPPGSAPPPLPPSSSAGAQAAGRMAYLSRSASGYPQPTTTAAAATQSWPVRHRSFPSNSG